MSMEMEYVGIILWRKGSDAMLNLKYERLDYLKATSWNYTNLESFVSL